MKTFKRPHPFTKVIRTVWNGDEKNPDYINKEFWRPGVWGASFNWSGDVDQFCHGLGEVVFTFLSEHKPSDRHHTRAFFTRKFITPDGVQIGKDRLIIKTKAALDRDIAKFPFDYEIDETADPIVEK